ncbi:Oidioi.mRNA.OKI2018_I69.XSR.g16293.t1.cds [Oikopleura dioica]|uniref:Oidioi.mRNA.OKI2018_I69.XSR.g16293.t1.cds n=1 Tax=Oikopleura dioica TaxID=34765 RepID=A0ABN7SKQ8_OIKDI|nr:Oidioi.mRNA.OKI2018_I69.XSR.g16293.t1.cds [Oikopleura dioica]
MGKCLQIIFVALNLLIGIGGLGLLGLSLWLLLDSESFYKLVDVSRETFSKNSTEPIPEEFTNMMTVFEGAIYLAIAVGSFTALLSLLGAFGGCCKNKFMLTIYMILVILLIIAELALVILAFVKYPIIDDFVGDRFNMYTNDTSDPQDPALIFNNDFVDTMRTTLDCCEWNSPANSTVVDAPATCCNPTSDTCAINDVSYRDDLCEDQLKKAGLILGGVGAGALVLEIFGIVAAVALRKKTDRYA